MLANSSCTRSLGALHPVCDGLEGSHGFTVGPLNGGVSQRELTSSVAGVAAFGTAAVFAGSLVHGARPSDM